MTTRTVIEELGTWKHDFKIDGLRTRDVNPDGAPVEYHPMPRWGYVKQYIPDSAEVAVDLGCAEGRITWEMSKMGISTVGVELEDDVMSRALFARDKIGGDYYLEQGKVTDYMEKSGKWDVVVANAILYHSFRPQKLIQLIQERAIDRYILETPYWGGFEGIKGHYYEDYGVRYLYTKNWLRDNLDNVIEWKDDSKTGYRALIIGEGKG